MNLKVLGLAAAMALTAPFAAQAASCDVGTCNVLVDSDGQTLDGNNTLNWFAANIVNEAVSDSFNFVANFVTGTTADAGGAVTVLQFNPAPGFGIIKNLVLTVFAPSEIAPQTFQITDANGGPAGPGIGNTVAFRILGLDTIPLGTLVEFELQGDATPTGAQNPSFQVTISAVPLPATALLFLSALAGLGFVSRRRAVA